MVDGRWIVYRVSRSLVGRLTVLHIYAINAHATRTCSQQELEAEGPLPDCSDSDEEDDESEMVVGGHAAATAALSLKGGFKG